MLRNYIKERELRLKRSKDSRGENEKRWCDVLKNRLLNQQRQLREMDWTDSGKCLCNRKVNDEHHFKHLEQCVARSSTISCNLSEQALEVPAANIAFPLTVCALDCYVEVTVTVTD